GARPRGDGPSRGARSRTQRTRSPERSHQRTRGLLPPQPGRHEAMVDVGRKREACRATVQESDDQSLARRPRRRGMLAMALVRWCVPRRSAVKRPGDAQCPGGAKRLQWGARPLRAGALMAWSAVGSEAVSWDLVTHEQDLVIDETKVPGPSSRRSR